MDIPKIQAPDRETWRSWLGENHLKEDKVWLVMHKRHTGKPAITHRESLEEAICYGWIDTIVKRIDDDTYMRQFVRRKEDADWSKNTLKYAEELLKEGKMVPAGKKAYERGKKKPPFDHHIPDNPRMPKELKHELAKDNEAKKNFKGFPPSYKRTCYRWLLHGKLEETRRKRAKKIVASAKDGSRIW